MESTAADAMPDDTDLNPQEPETEQSPADAGVEQEAEAFTPELNAVVELALKDLKERRDALEKEISELAQRKQQLEHELKTNFAGQSDAIARRVKGFQEYLFLRTLPLFLVLHNLRSNSFLYLFLLKFQLKDYY